MPWVIQKESDNSWCVYREGPDGGPIGKSRGCHSSREEALAQQRALYRNVDESHIILIGNLTLEADAEDKRILRFTNATLARAETNANQDDVDHDGIAELAASIAGMPIDIEHDPRKNVGVFTAGRVEGDELKVDGFVWTHRCEALGISPQDVIDHKLKLSIEAEATEAECSICGSVFQSAIQYCEHLLDRVKHKATRLLRGLKAIGGALTKRPAGTDAGFEGATIYMLASHGAEGITRREGVSEAERKRALGEYGDVKYADERNKKYPIDTEDHIRAAWNYIGQKRNQAKYSSEEVASIKRRIVAAWKDKIDKAGPPSASESHIQEGNMELEELKQAFESALQPVTAAIAGLGEKLDTLQAAMHQEEMHEPPEEDKKEKPELESDADVEATVAQLTQNLQQANADLKTAKDEVASYRENMLRARLVGTVMDNKEFEKRKAELLALTPSMIELIVQSARKPGARIQMAAADPGGDGHKLSLR